MTAKGAARRIVWNNEGGLLEGTVIGVADINFGIDEVRFFFLPIYCGRRVELFFETPIDSRNSGRIENLKKIWRLLPSTRIEILRSIPNSQSKTSPHSKS